MAPVKGFFGDILKKFTNSNYDYESFPDCMTAIQVEDPMIRHEALDSIRRLHLPLVTDIDKFAKIMRNDDNLQVQEAAMTLLGDLGTDECLDALIEMLISPDQWLRVKAIQVLGDTKNPRALTAIKEAYNGIRPDYQQAVRRTIDSMESYFKAQEEQKNKVFADPFAPDEVKDPGDLGAGPAYFPDYRTNPSNSTDEEEKQPKPQNSSLKYQYDFSASSQTVTFYDSEDVLNELLNHQLQVASGEPANPKIAGALHSAFTSHRVEAYKLLGMDLHSDKLPLQIQALQALITLNKVKHYKKELQNFLHSESTRMKIIALIAILSLEDDDYAADIVPFLSDNELQLKELAKNYFLLHPTLQNCMLLEKAILAAPIEQRAEYIRLLNSIPSEGKVQAFRALLNDDKVDASFLTSILENLPDSLSAAVSSAIPKIIYHADKTTFKVASKIVANGERELLLVEYLKLLLKSEDREARSRAIFLLSSIKDETNAPYIAKLLDDGDEFIKVQAAIALAELKSEDSISELLSNFSKAPNAMAKSEYLKAILKLGRESAFQKLLPEISKLQHELQLIFFEFSIGFNFENISDREKLYPLLTQFFTTQDIRIYFYTVLILLKLGFTKFDSERSKVLSTLWSLTKDSRNPTKIRIDALNALWKLAADEAFNSIVTLIDKERDPQFLDELLKCIVSSSKPEVEGILSKFASNPSKIIAAATQTALKKIQAKSERTQESGPSN